MGVCCRVVFLGLSFNVCIVASTYAKNVGQIGTSRSRSTDPDHQNGLGPVA